MSPLEDALAAGRQYALHKPLDADVPRAIRTFVDDFEALVDAQAGTAHVFAFVLERMFQPVTSFVAGGGVVDELLLRLMSDGRPLVTSPIPSQVFATVLRLGAPRSRERVACGLASVLLKVVETMPETGDVRHVVDLVECISSFEALRSLVAERALFRNLARRAGGDPDLLLRLCDVIRRGEYYMRRELAEDAIDGCLRLIASPSMRAGAPHVVHAADFVAACLCHNAALRGQFVDAIAALWRTGWFPALGGILAYELATPSVHLLVVLEKMGKLGNLIRAARDNFGCEWRVALRLLEDHWPERVAEALHRLPHYRMTGVTERVECPITHSNMRAPVVASDGNTYERDAILRHMVTLGRWSPLTRQPISYHLHENRALTHPFGDRTSDAPCCRT